MKSIVFYIGSLSRGGAERVIVNLAEFFFSQGYQVTIVTKMKEKTEYEVSEGIHRILEKKYLPAVLKIYTGEFINYEISSNRFNPTALFPLSGKIIL